MVRYLSLAHNYRDPETGRSTLEIIHNFGRAEHVDKDGLRRLIRSIARELDPADEAVALTAGSGEVRVVESRDLGGTWVLDQLWSRLGIGEAIRKVASSHGRRVDADKVERVLFGLVAGRALAPSSKLEACRWIADEVHIDGLEDVDHKTCYRAIDFLLDALDDLQSTVFFTVADLLQLEVDVLFFDTTSTYFQIELADDHEDVIDIDEADDDGDGDDEDGDRLRRFGHSKDHRPDRPQVVVGMAVTRGGVPVRLWMWPGSTQDQTVVEQVKADLAGWRLNRVVWIGDSAFNSEANRKVWQRGGSGFILAEKIRSREADVVAARGRQGRYAKVDDNLERDRAAPAVGDHGHIVHGVQPVGRDVIALPDQVALRWRIPRSGGPATTTFSPAACTVGDSPPNPSGDARLAPHCSFWQPTSSRSSSGSSRSTTRIRLASQQPHPSPRRQPLAVIGYEEPADTVASLHLHGEPSSMLLRSSNTHRMASQEGFPLEPAKTSTAPTKHQG